MINNPIAVDSDGKENKSFDKCKNGGINLASNAATILLNANNKRTHATFVNNSKSADITIILGNQTDGELDKGIVLKPNGGSYVITQVNLYVGRVCAIASVAGKISFVECSDD
jgi:hypothetical protein